VAFAQSSVAAYAKPRVDEYANIGGSCPVLRVKYDVDIREFVILACLNDADTVTKSELCSLLGLSPTTVDWCVNNLFKNGLIRESNSESKLYRLSTDGISLIRKAVEAIS